MLPKFFSYIPATNEYVNKLSDRMKVHLDNKLEKKSGGSLNFHNFDKFSSQTNPSRRNPNDLKIKFQEIQTFHTRRISTSTKIFVGAYWNKNNTT